MPTYDVSDHPLLGAKILAISKRSSEQFDEQVMLAEDLLGVVDTAYTERDLIRVRRAIALQLNYQLEIHPDLFLQKQASSSQSKQTVTYRDVIGLVSPLATVIMSSLRDEEGVGYGDIQSIRGA